MDRVEELWIQYFQYFQKHHDGVFDMADIPKIRSIIDELSTKPGVLIDDQLISWFLRYEQNQTSEH